MSCASESCPESCDKWSEQSAKDIVQLGDSLDPISIFAINYQRTRSRVDLKRALDAALSRYVSCNLLTDDSLLRDINAEFIIIILMLPGWRPAASHPTSTVTLTLVESDQQ